MKVTLIAALTADGFIARDAQQLSTRWTSKEDTRFFRQKAEEVGNFVVGSKTFATFNRKMSGRKIYVYSRSHQVANPYENDIEIISQPPKEFLATLEAQGVQEVLIAGGSAIYTMFMKAGVVDTLLLTHESTFFGQGVSLFSEALEVQVRLAKVHDLSEQTKVFEYEVSK